MPRQMIAIDGPNRTALLSEVSRCLFDHVVTMRDVTFGTYDDRAELNAIGEVPDATTPEALADALRALPSLDGASVKVGLFTSSATHRPQVAITHRVDIEGVAYLALLSQITYLFRGFDARIVRFTARRIPRQPDDHYIIRLSINIPPDQRTHCVEAITAATRVLDMTCVWSDLGG